MAGNKTVLSWCCLISESHVTVDFEAVVLLSVDSGPHTRVATPHNIPEPNQIILCRVYSIYLVALSDLVIIKLLKIFAHSHRADSIAGIETIEIVAGGIGGEEVASSETPGGTCYADEGVYFVGEGGA
jgi:hypothetical protein